MKNAVILTFAIALGACGASKSPSQARNDAPSSAVSPSAGDKGSPVSPELKPEPVETTVVSAAEIQALKAGARKYDRAIRCWALTDIVDILVKADVITAPAARKFSSLVAWQWRGRAMLLGESRGLIPSQVSGDFLDKKMGLLAQTQSVPESVASERIEEMVHEAGDCRI